MQTAQIIPFQFESREVRTLLIDDQPWLFAVDVCSALALSDTNKALLGLDSDEKCEHEQYSGSGCKPILINESGLYSLILRSRKPEAKRFKKWVTAEVLPAIRKHGRYEDAAGRMQTLLGETIGTDGFRMLGSLIRGKVASLPASVQRRATAKIWSQTHAAFGVRSAADIPARQLDAARNFVAAYAIEGEFLGRETPESCALGEEDLAFLYSFCANAMDLVAVGEKMRPALGALGSITLMNVPKSLENCRLVVGHLHDRFGRGMEDAARKHGLFVD